MTIKMTTPRRFYATTQFQSAAILLRDIEARLDCRYEDQETTMPKGGSDNKYTIRDLYSVVEQLWDELNRFGKRGQSEPCEFANWCKDLRNLERELDEHNVTLPAMY